MGVVGRALGICIGRVLVAERVPDRAADGDDGLELLNAEDGEMWHGNGVCAALKVVDSLHIADAMSFARCA